MQKKAADFSPAVKANCPRHIRRVHPWLCRAITDYEYFPTQAISVVNSKMPQLACQFKLIAAKIL